MRHTGEDVGLGFNLRDVGGPALGSSGSRVTDLEKGEIGIELEEQRRVTPKL